MESGRRKLFELTRARRIGGWTVLALAGAAFLLLGIVKGQAIAVLNKAIRVCLECIGIG